MAFLHSDLMTFLAVVILPLSLLYQLHKKPILDRGLIAILAGTSWISLGALLDYLEHIPQLGAFSQWLSQDYWNWIFTAGFYGVGVIVTAYGIVKWFPAALSWREEVERRRHAEEELRHLNRELRKTVLKLQDASKAKSNFLANMSHELRTPLNAILGYSELLQMNDRGHLSHRELDNVGNILSGGRHLLGLVEDLLDISGIEANQMRLRMIAVPVADCLDRARDTINPIAKEKSIEIQVSSDPSAPPQLETDPDRLHQILINLLSNAVRHSPEASQIQLRSSTSDSGEAIRFSVQDQGKGVSPENQNQIFEMFYREGENAYIAAEGTGLGLYVSKLLTEKMQGQIGLDSQPGKGSDFWIELPVKPSQLPLAG